MLSNSQRASCSMRCLQVLFMMEQEMIALQHVAMLQRENLERIRKEQEGGRQ